MDLVGFYTDNLFYKNNFLNPIGEDGIFTVLNLLITSKSPPETQGVAGGLFNTLSQTGKYTGLALTASLYFSGISLPCS